MQILSLLLLANVLIFFYILISKIQNKQFNIKWLEAIKQIGGFALGFGTFSTLIGLFSAFSALEESQDIIPFQVIMGGLKAGLISILYGLIIFCASLLAYIILKLSVRQPVS
jgi:biopolymer transport protein ExbB/TolQ